MLIFLMLKRAHVGGACLFESMKDKKRHTAWPGGIFHTREVPLCLPSSHSNHAHVPVPKEKLMRFVDCKQQKALAHLRYLEGWRC